ncbi:hypothetical protein LX99_02077 [Mucilaginibacter oryzae]|uniref:HEAT repeat protein n=1 Tax=Mucilaginibacter oryzae TaxID=468058 RepID=A0A316HCU8_9SPHI|nr:DUF6493 family protein [Mucilaginibacter oryzae]PWK78237.1 hypothetical protein LX99_02077 [Mucilaginibacter oryzae]
MSTFAEQYLKLLQEQRQADLFPLLQTLTDAEKKKFVPELKKLDTQYFKYEIIGKSKWGGDEYGFKSTDIQRYILNITHFVVYNRKDFEKANSGSVIKKKVLDTILPWHCPTWFSDYMNSFGGNEFIPHFIDYEWYMELVEGGYVTESASLIARILPRAIFKPLDRGQAYHPELLAERPVTLQKHIWYIFEHGGEVHWSDGNEQYWLKTFKDFCERGLLERSRVLKEAAMCFNRNFNQSLAGWFTNLLVYLEPNKAELIKLQSILLNTLNSPHSKPVNTVLKLLKDIAGDDGFEQDQFIEHCPLVLSSDSKTTVTNTLMILEKLAKKHQNRRNEISILASQALIHQDDKLQVRTAKLISKYADSTSLDVWEAVSAYQQGLLFEARTILEPFLIPEAPADDEAAHFNLTTEPAEREPIPFPKNFDELVYLASQAFDQNEAYHFDLLPAAILSFQHEMTEDNIRKLLPAFQRAFKTTTGDWVSDRGYLDSLLSKFLTSYGLLLIKFYPSAAQSFKDLYDDHLSKLKEKNQDTRWFESGIKAWEVYTHSKGYKPHKHILLNAFWALEHNLQVPLLSTPTHQPSLVDVKELIRRISVYQSRNTRPGLMDYQVAVMRCFADNRDEAISLANTLLRGESRQLIGFILGEDHQPAPQHHLQPVWLAAVLTHRRHLINQWAGYSKWSEEYLLANFSWSSYIEHYEQDRYNYQTRVNEKIPATREAVIVSIDKKEATPVISGIKSLWNKLTGNKTAAAYEEGYFDFVELKYKYISAEQNDIKRLIYLSPHWPEHWLMYINKDAFRYFDLQGENDKKLVIYALEALMTLKYNYGEAGHLFIATCMLLNDKTVRLYAAELWIKGVKEQTLNSKKLGEIIGKHEYNGLAPLKRFTDLIFSGMLHISPVHDREMEQLLTACISSMNKKPVNNTKKLLDIYLEVLAANKQPVIDAQASAILTEWEKSGNSLTAVIGRIKQGFSIQKS